jgi:hypothetical protein
MPQKETVKSLSHFTASPLLVQPDHVHGQPIEFSTVLWISHPPQQSWDKRKDEKCLSATPCPLKGKPQGFEAIFLSSPPPQYSWGNRKDENKPFLYSRRGAKAQSF